MRLALESTSQEAVTHCQRRVSSGGRDSETRSSCHSRHPEGLFLCHKTDLLRHICSWESKEPDLVELKIS